MGSGSSASKYSKGAAHCQVRKYPDGAVAAGDEKSRIRGNVQEGSYRSAEPSRRRAAPGPAEAAAKSSSEQSVAVYAPLARTPQDAIRAVAQNPVVARGSAAFQPPPGGGYAVAAAACPAASGHPSLSSSAQSVTPVLQPAQAETHCSHGHGHGHHHCHAHTHNSSSNSTSQSQKNGNDSNNNNSNSNNKNRNNNNNPDDDSSNPTIRNPSVPGAQRAHASEPQRGPAAALGAQLQEATVRAVNTPAVRKTWPRPEGAMPRLLPPLRSPSPPRSCTWPQQPEQVVSSSIARMASDYWRNENRGVSADGFSRPATGSQAPTMDAGSNAAATSTTHSWTSRASHAPSMASSAASVW
ncbi:unnamed protein product [Polarella glacialis]|uniref:Uncharacterized protein n=1 Tax=Polarella glacialis TaxID=89957 RepID=A0A813FNP0_POLGL|nr:unnamed protein product [Polarella glacialis]CAE8665735.1 unnamed protein product [Polarella glacialis]